MEPSTQLDLNALLAALEAKRAALDAAIGGVKILLGDPEFSQLVVQAAPSAPAAHAARDYANGPIDPDDPHAFFGMSVSTAAQKYLGAKKKPASAQEIADALEKGGFPSQTGQFGKTVTTTMYRGNDTFVKVKRGLWGLKAWYPNYRVKDAD